MANAQRYTLIALVAAALVMCIVVIVRHERREQPTPPVFGNEMQGEWWAEGAGGELLFVIYGEGGWCARAVGGQVDVYEMRAISRHGNYDGGAWKGNIQLDGRGSARGVRLRGTLESKAERSVLSLSRLISEATDERGFGVPLELRRVGDGDIVKLRRTIDDVRSGGGPAGGGR